MTALESLHPPKNPVRASGLKEHVK